MVYSQYISTLFEEKISAEERHSPDKLFTTGNDIQHRLRSDEILEDIVADTLQQAPQLYSAQFPPHWGFIASSSAFLWLIKRLQDMNPPTFFSQTRKHIMEAHDVQGRRLLPILKEPQWAVGKCG